MPSPNKGAHGKLITAFADSNAPGKSDENVEYVHGDPLRCGYIEEDQEEIFPARSQSDIKIARDFGEKVAPQMGTNIKGFKHQPGVLDPEDPTADEYDSGGSAGKDNED